MVSETQHTPGPWEPGRPHMATLVDGVESKWVYADDQYVAVASGRIRGDWGEVMANARLIAAAPDLLAALKLILQSIPSEMIGDYESDLAYVAIAKAEGRGGE